MEVSYIRFLIRTNIYGIERKNTVPQIKLGTTIKNFDFIFCDFIKHPIPSIISEKISNIVRNITIHLKLINSMLDIVFSKLVIYSSVIYPLH